MRATCHCHLIIVDLIILIIFDKEYKLWRFSLCSFLQPPIILFLFGQNIFFSTLFLYTLNLCSLLNIRDQVSHPYWYYYYYYYYSDDDDDDDTSFRTPEVLPWAMFALRLCTRFSFGAWLIFYRLNLSMKGVMPLVLTTVWKTFLTCEIWCSYGGEYAAHTVRDMTDISEERIDSVFSIELCLLLACSPHSSTLKMEASPFLRNVGKHRPEYRTSHPRR
jgi:hypothetical protein